jgi:hypothetical protein
MKDEALDLALEALDIVKIHFTQNRHVNEAITAIEQALAAQPAPVQEMTNIQRHEQNVQKFLAAQPAPVQPVAWTAPEQCDSPEICRIGRACADQFGTQKKCTTQPAQPAVPDAIHHTDLSEHPQYIEGWNDCRAEMLKGMKP